jgi:hypothetical protein
MDCSLVSLLAYQQCLLQTQGRRDLNIIADFATIMAEIVVTVTMVAVVVTA